MLNSALERRQLDLDLGCKHNLAKLCVWVYQIVDGHIWEYKPGDLSLPNR